MFLVVLDTGRRAGPRSVKGKDNQSCSFFPFYYRLLSLAKSSLTESSGKFVAGTHPNTNPEQAPGLFSALLTGEKALPDRWTVSVFVGICVSVWSMHVVVNISVFGMCIHVLYFFFFFFVCWCLVGFLSFFVSTFVFFFVIVLGFYKVSISRHAFRAAVLVAGDPCRDRCV